MILISEKSPVLKSDFIIESLEEPDYSSPIFKGILSNNEFSVALLRPIKLIVFITFE